MTADQYCPLKDWVYGYAPDIPYKYKTRKDICTACTAETVV